MTTTTATTPPTIDARMARPRRRSPDRLAAWLGLAALTVAGAVQAQQVGTYIGSTTEGDYVELKVESDEFGNPMLTSALSFWTATCTRSGSRGSAWGVGFFNPVVDRKVTAELRSNGLYEKWNLKFNAAGTRVHGTFIARTPEFVDVLTNTKQVELCDTGTRELTADLQPPAAAGATAPRLRPGQVQALTR